MTARTLDFKIHGMDCAEEVAILKREVGPLVGGEDRLRFDILNGRLTVTPETAELTAAAICQAVSRTGMRADIWRTGPEMTEEPSFWQRRGRITLTFASGLFTALGFIDQVGLVGGFRAGFAAAGAGEAVVVPLAARVLYGLGILTGAWFVLPKAWFAARRMRPDMNLLMTVAVLGAVVIGEWFEASTVAFLFALSLALESWSVGRARRAVAALMDLTPPTARRLRADGGEEVVAPSRVAVGDRFVVRPGERIPLDGRVVGGASEVNQAPITGESVPVAKSLDQEVLAGTINGDGALTVQCTKLAGDSTLAQIIRLVGEAQSRRAPSEQWVEKFARVYTPAVMLLALAVLVIPTLFFGGAWPDWMYRSLVLLVIACPCALVISTPVSIVAMLAASARHGVLIKGGLYVEAPARVKAIAFDKTGTLTQGTPRVVEVVPWSGHDERELLERSAALEAHSTHPLAQAIVAYAQQHQIQIRPATQYQIVPGKGAMGRLEGQDFWVGSRRYLEERGQATVAIHERLEAMATAGQTIVVVGNAAHVCGFIALADAIRPETRQTLQALRDTGVRHIVMLTGDNRETAEAIGREAGVDEVQAELMPADKVAAVESLVAKYGQVAMVGDGVNDAPALGRATLGIAMGAAGSDAAIEAADIALMSDDLAKLPWLIRHSRRTLAIIRQNIAFSLGIKAFFVALTFVGYTSLWAAIAADTGASLLVIFNSLRLLNVRASA